MPFQGGELILIFPRSDLLLGLYPVEGGVKHFFLLSRGREIRGLFLPGLAYCSSASLKLCAGQFECVKSY